MLHVVGVFFQCVVGLEIVRWACARLGGAAPPTVAKTELAAGKIVNRAASRSRLVVSQSHPRADALVAPT